MRQRRSEKTSDIFVGHVLEALVLACHPRHAFFAVERVDMGHIVDKVTARRGGVGRRRSGHERESKCACKLHVDFELCWWLYEIGKRCYR